MEFRHPDRQNTEQAFSLPKRYAVLITTHARQRWMERVVDPERYSHLKGCKVSCCEECLTKIQEIRNILRDSRRNVDSEIARRVREARAAKAVVKDMNFMAAIKKRYGEEKVFEFLQDHSAVYVITHPPNEPSPVLLTVMSLDMIDGMVFQTFKPEELKPVFERWKHERRQGIK